MNMHIINLSTDESIPLINSDQVIDILYNTDHHNCIFGSSNANDVTKISNEVLDAIKTRNSNISDIGDQMLPVVYNYTENNKFYTEIEIGKYSDIADRLFIFSTPYYEALTDSSARKPLSSKALNSLAMMGHLLNNSNKGE